jgi:hypothetical protein
MSRSSDVSNVSRRDFIAGSAATAGYLTAGANPSLEAAAAAAPTTHQVTMTVLAGNTIKYTKDDGSSADPLTVPPGHKVVWRAVTSGPHHHLAVLFTQGTPFSDDSNGSVVYAFHGSDQQEDGVLSTIGNNATIVQKPPAPQYKYSVAIFDKQANTTAVDDPHIIIGTVDLYEEKKQELRMKADVEEALKAEAVLKGRLEGH